MTRGKRLLHDSFRKEREILRFLSLCEEGSTEFGLVFAFLGLSVGQALVTVVSSS